MKTWHLIQEWIHTKYPTLLPTARIKPLCPKIGAAVQWGLYTTSTMSPISAADWGVSIQISNLIIIIIGTNIKITTLPQGWGCHPPLLEYTPPNYHPKPNNTLKWTNLSLHDPTCFQQLTKIINASSSHKKQNTLVMNAAITRAHDPRKTTHGSPK